MLDGLQFRSKIDGSSRSIRSDALAKSVRPLRMRIFRNLLVSNLVSDIGAFSAECGRGVNAPPSLGTSAVERQMPVVQPSNSRALMSLKCPMPSPELITARKSLRLHFLDSSQRMPQSGSEILPIRAYS